MNPDAYNFQAHCKEFGQQRTVASSRTEIQSSNPVTVYAIVCDHSWTLSSEETKKLREHVTTAA